MGHRHGRVRLLLCEGGDGEGLEGGGGLGRGAQRHAVDRGEGKHDGDARKRRRSGNDTRPGVKGQATVSGAPTDWPRVDGGGGREGPAGTWSVDVP